MTFWDHLEVLRGTIFRSLSALLIVSCIGLFFREFLFETIVLGPAGSISFVNLEIAGQFISHMYASLIFGVVVSFPYIMWELWRFIAPALYEEEKKSVLPGFIMSAGLFYAGVAVGYFVILPLCLNFFHGYVVSASVVNSFSLQSYMSLFLSTILLTGIAFEFPVLMVILSAMGIVDRDMLRGKRRYALVAVLVMAALITPADPGSMFVVSIPLYGLYELGILCCKK